MKIKLLFIGSIATFLLPIQGMLILVSLCVLLDTIYSIYAEIKLRGRMSFKSKVLRLGMSSKIIGYFLSIIIMYLVDVYIFGGAIYGIKFLLSKSISMIWVYSELKSVDESRIILGKKPFLDICKELIKGIKKFNKDFTSIKKD